MNPTSARTLIDAQCGDGEVGVCVHIVNDLCQSIEAQAKHSVRSTGVCCFHAVISELSSDTTLKAPEGSHVRVSAI